jgi:hypothetical protein
VDPPRLKNRLKGELKIFLIRGTGRARRATFPARTAAGPSSA